jgi:dTDP-4-dehydrorhamnose reductase
VAAARHEGSLVVRTNFFGARAGEPGRSLAEWALCEWAAGRPVDGFQDVRFNPLWTGHLARTLLDLASREESGVLHVAGRTAASKFEFLRALAAAFGFPEAFVRPSTQASRRWRAERPVCTVLDVTRAETILGAPMPGLEEGLRDFRRWAEERGVPSAPRGGVRGPA